LRVERRFGAASAVSAAGVSVAGGAATLRVERRFGAASAVSTALAATISRAGSAG